MKRSSIAYFLRQIVVGYMLTTTMVSCEAQKPGKTYSEDLSGYRPKFVTPGDTTRKETTIDSTQFIVSIEHTRNVNTTVDAVLDSIDRLNVTKKFVDGYTIQVYSGQKREDAMNAKLKVMTDAPELTANLQYIQPKFRVTIGSYFTKLEAQKDLMRLKRIVPNAILVPIRILIK